MFKTTIVSSLCVLVLAASAAFGQTPGSLSADARSAWTAISGNLVKSAEKLPEADYAFRPTASVRSFGELIGHVTDAHYAICSPISDEKRAPQGAEKTLKAKADLVAALKQSVAYCTAAAERLTDARAAETVKVFGRDMAQLSVLHMNIAHDNEHYGNVVTYLRLKGLVPPSSETRPAPKTALRLLYDQAHGESAAPGPMAEIATRLDLGITTATEPITAASLQGVNLVYLRSPSKAFSAQEKDAIITFVKGGGSLLLVLDEEVRQSLAATGVNDIIAPFGMRLTPDTEYVHNCGAIAKAGDINKADREIPYSGGRAIEGGTPFAFQLDKAGKPAQPFAAWKKLDNGARIVVMGEGMASLFLGKPEGARLSGAPRDVGGTTFWGKDSTVFMDEVLTWLVKK